MGKAQPVVSHDFGMNASVGTGLGELMSLVEGKTMVPKDRCE